MTPCTFRCGPSGARHQLGVGLVELMISIAIGLVLVVLVTSYYLSSRQSYQTTIVTSALTDSQRYTIQLLRRQLLLAGYSDSWTHRESNFPDRSGSNGVPDFDDGQVLMSNSADEIWFRMQGAALDDQPIVSCSNNEIDVAGDDEEPIVAIVRLYLDDATLMCETYIFNDPTPPDTDPVPLLNGVDALAFTYLDDSDEFQPYDMADWISVRAVQLDILIRSEMETYDAPFAQSFIWPGGNKSFEDRHMRSRLTRTIALRNVGGG